MKLPPFPLAPRFFFVPRSATLAQLLVVLLAAGSAAAAPDPNYASALAELRRQRADTAVLGTTLDHLAEINRTFYGRVPMETLGPRELAELVRLDAFRHGEVALANAKLAAERLLPFVSAPNEEGALAASLRVLLSASAGIKGDERTRVVNTALHHPAYVELLNGEFGDLAVDTACRAGMRSDLFRESVMSLPAKLDATKSTAAAESIRDYWSKVEQAIPQGTARQELRRQLVAYLTAVLAKGKDSLGAKRYDELDSLRARLNSAEARGERLEGQPAPEITFLWSSENNWKSTADLRGKVVVLDFWATWCGACVGSFPEIAKLTERYRGADVVVLGVTSLQGAVHGLGGKAIDCRNDPEKEMRLMADYIKAKGVTWPIVFSREKMLNPAYGVNGIPTLVVIAPDGTVRSKIEGYDAKIIDQIDATLREFNLPVSAALPNL